jgi:hypothetical protein
MHCLGDVAILSFRSIHSDYLVEDEHRLVGCSIDWEADNRFQSLMKYLKDSRVHPAIR